MKLPLKLSSSRDSGQLISLTSWLKSRAEVIFRNDSGQRDLLIGWLKYRPKCSSCSEAGNEAASTDWLKGSPRKSRFSPRGHTTSFNPSIDRSPKWRHATLAKTSGLSHPPGSSQASQLARSAGRHARRGRSRRYGAHLSVHPQILGRFSRHSQVPREQGSVCMWSRTPTTPARVTPSVHTTHSCHATFMATTKASRQRLGPSKADKEDERARGFAAHPKRRTG